MGPGAWPLLWVVVGRLVRRTTPARPALKLLPWAGALLTTAGAALLWSDLLQVVGAAMVAAGGLLTVSGLCLRWFPPALAVSAIGVALSCASLITALAVTSGFLQELVRNLGRFNGHVLVSKYGLDFYEYEQVAAQVLTDPRVVAASPFAYAMVSLSREPEGELPVDPDVVADGPAGDDPWDAALQADARLSPTLRSPRGDSGPAEGKVLAPAIVVGKGIDPRRARQLHGLAQAFGRGDLSGLRPGGPELPGLVLGRELARRLDAHIGDRVRVVVAHHRDGTAATRDAPVRHAVFEVLDLIDTGVQEFDRNLALMHLTAAQSLFFGAGRVTGIEFELTDPELADAVVADLAGMLPTLFRLSTWREANAAVLHMLEQGRVALSLVLGLMVLVAAFSLVASLVLLARSKRHDVGVLLALGCDGGAIFWIFEVVGIVAGLTGASLGAALAGLYCAALARYDFPLAGDVYPVDHLPVLIRPIDVLAPVGVALVLCALASGPVAALAGRTRVIAALNR